MAALAAALGYLPDWLKRTILSSYAGAARGLHTLHACCTQCLPEVPSQLHQRSALTTMEAPAGNLSAHAVDTALQLLRFGNARSALFLAHHEFRDLRISAATTAQRIIRQLGASSSCARFGASHAYLWYGQKTNKMKGPC